MNIAQNAYPGNKKKSFSGIITHLFASDFLWQDAAKIFDQHIDSHSSSYSSAMHCKATKAIINSTYGFKLLNRVGSEVVCNLSSGNICIFSTRSSVSAILNIKIINFLLFQNRPFKIIKGSAFAKLALHEKSNTKIQYLIQIDLNNISYMGLPEIVRFCRTNFIFKIPGLNINTKAAVEDQSGMGALFYSFSEESNLIKHLVASLGEEEFVVVSDGKIFVSSLPQEESVDLSKNN